MLVKVSKEVQEAIKNNIPVYAVKNKSVLDVSSDKMGLRVLEFESYDECLNYLIS